MVESSWKCLSNHGLVLIALSSNSDIRIRELAEKVGLTERAVQRILTDKRDPGIRSEAATALVLLRRGGAIQDLV